MLGIFKKKSKLEFENFKTDHLSPGARALVHSFVYSPEKWKSTNIKMVNEDKHYNDPDVWDNGTLYIVYKESKYYGSYTICGNRIDHPHGFSLAGPHVQHFDSAEQKILIEAFKYMVGKKTELSVHGGAPQLSYAELLSFAEELMKNNKTYVLTSSDERIRKWAERLLKDSKS